MNIISYCSGGFEGDVVFIESDIRNGIPGVDLVGMPDTAVRESVERVRIAIKNSGYQFPGKRIVVNLAPAGIRKEGAAFDLPIAVSILLKSNLISCDKNISVMIIGELQLSGRIRPAPGVLSAVIAGMRENTDAYLVPEENLKEAYSSGAERVYPCGTLGDAASVIESIGRGGEPDRKLDWQMDRKLDWQLESSDAAVLPRDSGQNDRADLSITDIKGQPFLKRSMAVAAAGMHNMLIFGPPGSGKTMAGNRAASLLPDLDQAESVEVTRIYSLAGLLRSGEGLIRRPPFRSPHHTSSMEGLIGGGRNVRPGEVSLAHKGVLFLDETPEFRKSILQCLREPVESGRVDLARAGRNSWFPADFQLILAANPCPCGNRGKDEAVCLCSDIEIHRYWKRIGGALIDRIDIRVPVLPVDAEKLIEADNISEDNLKKKVFNAVEIQNKRFKDSNYRRNSRIPPGEYKKYIRFSEKGESLFIKAVRRFSLSSRASFSIIKIARTCADMQENCGINISDDNLLEAIQLRRYGDGDFFW